MKKENRKMAQERKAQEREKMKKQKKVRMGLMIGLPVLAVALILAVFAIPEKKETVSQPVQTEAPKLNMDTELVVENGDKVNIDFVGSIDGVEFAGGNTRGMGTDVVIGAHKFIGDFEEQLIGHAVGESVDVVVTFPKNYSAEDLAGKEAVFVTKINGIYK